MSSRNAHPDVLSFLAGLCPDTLNILMNFYPDVLFCCAGLSICKKAGMVPIQVSHPRPLTSRLLAPPEGIT